MSPLINLKKDFQMEPSLKSKNLARDLFVPLSMLELWSEIGFQHFLESGVLHDILEAIEQNKIPIIGIRKYEMISQSTTAGNVSFGQAVKFLSAISKTNIKSFCTAFSAWSVTAGWWEENGEVDWVMRDEWREEMGIDRLNPILKSLENGIEVIFRELGGQNVQNFPPPRYRYATLEEVSKTNVPKGDWMAVLVCSGSNWFISYGCPVIDEYVASTFREGFVRDYNRDGNQHPQAYVALVKS